MLSIYSEYQKRYQRPSWRLDIMEEYLKTIARRCSPVTVLWHKKYLNGFILFLNETQPPNKPVDNEMIQEFYDWLGSRNLAYQTIRGYHRCLRQMFKYCVDQGYITKNPTDGIQFPRPPQFIPDVYTPGEVARLLLACEQMQTPYKERNAAILLIRYDTGARLGGVINAKVNDLDIEDHKIKLFEKGRKQRIVGFGDRTAQALQRHLEVKFRSEYLFSNANGCQLSGSGIYKALRQACSIARVRPRKFHLLRYAFAGEFLPYADTGAVQFALGHNSAQTTEIYLRHVRQNQVCDLMQKYSPADRLEITQTTE